MSDFYVGLMSGTSMDGIDAVLIEDLPGFPGRAHASLPYRPETRALLETLVTSAQCSLRELLRADQLVAEDFAACCARLAEQLDPVTRNAIRAIGLHGQTVYHAPRLQQTLQLGNPSHIATQLGLPVVADIRRADLAAGGQGAPLAPAYHNQAFRSRAENRVILNLGGIANASLLPADLSQPVSGFDTGPASTLMDLWIQAQRNRPYDDNGDWARSGQVENSLLQAMLSDPYFQAAAPKSTGREHFHLNWLQTHLRALPEMPAENIQATLCELTAQTIAEAIRREGASEYHVYVCGGGWNNKLLIQRLQAQLGDSQLDSTSVLGVAPQHVEGAAFAWIARQHLHRQPANLPSVTGAAKPVILGALYPANN